MIGHAGHSTGCPEPMPASASQSCAWVLILSPALNDRLVRLFGTLCSFNFLDGVHLTAQVLKRRVSVAICSTVCCEVL